MSRAGHIKQDEGFTLSDFHQANGFDVSSLQDDPRVSAQKVVSWLTRVGGEHGVAVVFEHEDAFRFLGFIEEFCSGVDISEIVTGFVAPSAIFCNAELWAKADGIMPRPKYLGGTGFGLQSVCNGLSNISFKID